MSGFEKTLITKDRTLNNGNTIFYYLSFILKTPLIKMTLITQINSNIPVCLLR